MNIGTTLFLGTAGYGAYALTHYNYKIEEKKPKEKKEKTEKKPIQKKDVVITRNSINTGITTTVITTASSVFETVSRSNTIDGIYQKYSAAYIDSMSDQQLAKALEEVDLLERENLDLQENKIFTKARV